MLALMFTLFTITAQAAEPLTQKYHVQINQNFHLFQYETIGSTHVLIYIQRAYNSDGEYIGWITQQVAGPWGNSVNYLKDKDDIDKAFMEELKVAMRISTELEFVLAGVFEPAYWTANHVLIAGDPLHEGWK